MPIQQIGPKKSFGIPPYNEREEFWLTAKGFYNRESCLQPLFAL